MSKRHQRVASGKATRTGQHRSGRHTAKQMLTGMAKTMSTPRVKVPKLRKKRS